MKKPYLSLFVTVLLGITSARADMQCDLSDFAVVLHTAPGGVGQAEIYRNHALGNGRMSRNFQITDRVFGPVPVKLSSEGTHSVADGPGFRILVKLGANSGYTGILVSPTEVAGFRIPTNYPFYCETFTPAPPVAIPPPSAGDPCSHGGRFCH